MILASCKPYNAPGMWKTEMKIHLHIIDITAKHNSLMPAVTFVDITASFLHLF